MVEGVVEVGKMCSAGLNLYSLHIKGITTRSSHDVIAGRMAMAATKKVCGPLSGPLPRQGENTDE